MTYIPGNSNLTLTGYIFRSPLSSFYPAALALSSQTHRGSSLIVGRRGWMMWLGVIFR